jgi:transposase-like protein
LLASKSLESIVKRTHISIWKWVKRFSECADKFRADKRSIKVIFVDETLIKINGQDHWLWIAYEPNIHSCLLFHLSRERTIFVCYQFFRQIRSRYGSKVLSIRMVEIGIMMLVNGKGLSISCMIYD